MAIIRLSDVKVQNRSLIWRLQLSLQIGLVECGIKTTLDWLFSVLMYQMIPSNSKVGVSTMGVLSKVELETPEILIYIRLQLIHLILPMPVYSLTIKDSRR